MVDLLGRLPAELRLMIVELLPLDALAKLRRTNKQCWHPVATAEMYTLDARTNNSESIRWAAAVVDDQDLAIKIIQASASYGGNVNAVERNQETSAYATPIHYAAAYGHTRVVRELIKLGAEVNSWSSGLSWFHELGLRYLRYNMRTKYPWLSSGRWSPMVVPIVNNDVKTATLLMQRSADAHVVSLSAHEAQAVPANRRPNITVYHLLAAFVKHDLHRWEAFFQHSRYRSAINARMFLKGTALSLAIDMENGSAFTLLLQAGARPDGSYHIVSWASTPLIIAIRKAYALGIDARRREVIISWIKALISAGATVNAPSLSSTSPLSFAVEGYEKLTKVSRTWCGPGDVIDILLQNNANANFRRFDRRTILQYLYDSITEGPRPKAASLDLFERLLRNGADVNLPPAPGGQSLLLKSMCCAGRVSAFLPLHRLLLRAHARLLDGEACEAFNEWCSNAHFRRHKLFDVSNANLQQDWVDGWWTQAIMSADQRLCHCLLEVNLLPSNGDDLVHTLVQSHPKRTLDFVGHFNFSPHCLSQDEDRSSLLHATVKKYCDGAITRALAVRILKHFIDKGVPLTIRDAHGKLAPDYLVDVDRCAPVRQLLTEAYYEESRK